MNSRELRKRFPGASFDGITHSAEEASLAKDVYRKVWCGDLEQGIPDTLRDYSAILCLHVLEHLRDPASLVADLARRLAPGGVLVIAVPNVAHYGQRLALLRGAWAYTDFGLLDWTHLRFFTFQTARELLVPPGTGLTVDRHEASPSLPLGRLRRMPGAASTYSYLERRLLAAWPNLFGWQILIRARRLPAA